MSPAKREDSIRRVTPAELRGLVARASTPCASLYLPLETGVPQVKQNPVRYRQAVETVAERLGTAHLDAAQVEAWRERLRSVETDVRALVHPALGLAVFCDAERLRAYALASPVPYRVAVGRSFALRPLVRAADAARPFVVLALSVNRVALFEGDGRGLRPLETPEVPASLEAALGSERVGGELQFHSSAARGGAPIYHGHSGSREERSVDLDRFHHAIAQAVSERLKAQDLAVVLAADQIHQGPFRAVAKLRGLLRDGAVGNPDRLSPEELHARTWPVVAAAIAREKQAAAESLERARKRTKAVDLLDDVAAAAVAGRVHRLWVEDERAIPGRVDEATGRILAAAGDEDVLDELTAAVLRRSGEVFVTEAARMPSETGAAAELR